MPLGGSTPHPKVPARTKRRLRGLRARERRRAADATGCGPHCVQPFALRSQGLSASAFGVAVRPCAAVARGKPFVVVALHHSAIQTALPKCT